MPNILNPLSSALQNPDMVISDPGLWQRPRTRDEMIAHFETDWDKLKGFWAANPETAASSADSFSLQQFDRFEDWRNWFIQQHPTNEIVMGQGAGAPSPLQNALQPVLQPAIPTPPILQPMQQPQVPISPATQQFVQTPSVPFAPQRGVRLPAVQPARPVAQRPIARSPWGGTSAGGYQPQMGAYTLGRSPLEERLRRLRGGM